MKQITLRDIPEEIGRWAKKEARRKGVSLNKVLVALLEKGAGLKPPYRGRRREYHDLDHLFGVWSEKEARDFDESLASQREIDGELWKKTE